MSTSLKNRTWAAITKGMDDKDHMMMLRLIGQRRYFLELAKDAHREGRFSDWQAWQKDVTASEYFLNKNYGGAWKNELPRKLNSRLDGVRPFKATLKKKELEWT